MNSFIRRTIARTLTLGAVATSLIGAGLSANPALALTNEQVAEKLSSVPVFVIGNGDGLLLISSDQEGLSQQPSLYVFMNQQDAETFLARANQANPEFAPNAEVGVTSLQRLYQESQANSEQPLNLIYVPEEAEARQAAEINTDYRGGVPLFFARREDGSVAPVQQNNGETFFPMFFSREDLEGLLNELAQRDPEARQAISIGVLPLEAMLMEMRSSDDASLDQIRLLPDSETLSGLGSQSAPSAAPAETPQGE